MKTILVVISIFIYSPAFAQRAENIDLSHWKLELPSGYSASEWKLSNFQKDRFAKPFFYTDSTDGSLVMEAYPVSGTSKAKYTKNSLREQVIPGESSKNWSMTEGGELIAEFQVVEMSKQSAKKYYKTILFQVQGRSTKHQMEELDLEKSVTVPLLTIYWQDERIRVKRKVLKDVSTVGDALAMKGSWQDNEGRYFNKKVSFEKTNIKIIVSEDKVEIHLNDQKPMIFKDASIRKWPFENYFNAGNYLQTKDYRSKSKVKYYKLQVTH